MTVLRVSNTNWGFWRGCFGEKGKATMCARESQRKLKKCDLAKKTSRGIDGAWKAWKAKKAAFHPSHTPWKSLRGFPHYHGFDDHDYLF
jgi:hypothetical protein